MALSPLDSVTDFGQFTGLRAQARELDPAALLKTAKQFEALMLQQMLKSMRAATPGEDVLGGGEQTNFYRDMFDQQLSVQLSAGKGIGLADMLVKQLQMSQALGEAAAPVALDTTIPERQPEVATTTAVTEVAAPVALKTDNTLDDFRPQTPQEFVEALLPHAEKAAQELGIPARVLVAQAALETGWGKHQIRHADGSPSFNLFGIKADKSWDGERVRTMTHEYENGRMEQQSAKFRAYDSIAESFEDYVQFLKSNPRYEQALSHQGSAQQFTTGLQKAGYATDPSYAEKIMRIAYGPTVQLALNKTAMVTA